MWQDQQFKVAYDFLENFSWKLNLLFEFLPQACCIEHADTNGFLMSKPKVEPQALLANKPTNSLLDYDIYFL